MTEALTPETLASLVTATGAALRNNAQFEMSDTAGRAWFVAPDVVDNRSVVLIRVTRGQDTHVRNLSTATLVPDVAEAAITDLDGALP